MEKIGMTTKELRSLEAWRDIETTINQVIKETRKLFPNDKIELVDKGTCFHIELNGNPITEIDAISLIQ
jgi:hypothetical protein